jgi:hypothetical protein
MFRFFVLEFQFINFMLMLVLNMEEGMVSFFLLLYVQLAYHQQEL